MENCRVLVVDDLTTNCELIGDILEGEEQSYEVTKCSSGDEAIKYLDQDWDVVITDKNMPGEVDGIDLLREVKRKTSADVILMTGFPNLDTAIESVRGQAFDYLIKPISVNVFRMTMKRYVEKRRLNEELAREKALRKELASAYEKLEKMSQIKKVFGQFTTDEVVKFAVDNPDFWKKNKIIEATVLFADICNFTSFSQSEEPIDVVKTVNGIHSCIFNAVVDEGGVLNKFLGDGLLAMFGAPLNLPNHAEAAVRAALKAQEKVEALNALRVKEGFKELPVRIGINSGEMVAGCVGTNERTEYTVMGHSVNCASRLEESASAGEIVVGEKTFELIGEKFGSQKREPISFRGIQGEICSYRILRTAKTFS